MKVNKTANSILAALPEVDRNRLLDSSDAVEIGQRFTFYDPARSPQYVCFLESGMASELIRVSDGRSVDAAPIGRDGLVGIPALFGQISIHHCVMQVPGQVWRIPVPTARTVLQQSASFRKLLNALVHARFCQATQSAACNLLHSIEKRLARWLLTARFHVRSDTLNITQEFVSEMLGANRSTVNECVGTLERAGLIAYQRGMVHIVDAARLGSFGCECYRLIEKVFRSVREAAKEAGAD